MAVLSFSVLLILHKVFSLQTLSYSLIYPLTSLFKMKSTFILATLACATHFTLAQPTPLRSHQGGMASEITTRSPADNPVSALLHGLLHLGVGEGKNGVSLLTLNVSF